MTLNDSLNFCEGGEYRSEGFECDEDAVVVVVDDDCRFVDDFISRESCSSMSGSVSFDSVCWYVEWGAVNRR